MKQDTITMLSALQVPATNPLSAKRIEQDLCMLKSIRAKWVSPAGEAQQKMTSQGARIAAARKIKGWTQRQLAKAVGVSPGAIAQYEQDIVASIAGPTLLDISTALDVSARWLVSGGSHMQRPIQVSAEEADLLHTFRELTQEAQDLLRSKAPEYHEIAGPKTRTRVHPTHKPKN